MGEKKYFLVLSWILVFQLQQNIIELREIKGEYRLSVQRRAIKFRERKGDLRVVKKEKLPPLSQEPINACPVLCFRTKTSISSLPSKWTTVECSPPLTPIFIPPPSRLTYLPLLAPYVGTPFLSLSINSLQLPTVFFRLSCAAAAASAASSEKLIKGEIPSEVCYRCAPSLGYNF